MRDLRSAVVTGATGFIGSALVRRLLDDGIQTYCLLREKPRSHSALESLGGAEVVEISPFQTRELERCLMEFSADVIFNLASSGVSQDDRDPEALLDGNVNLVARLVSAAANSPPKLFIHAGSCSEYGPPLSEGSPFIEGQPLKPTSLYGAAKAASELYGNALAAGVGVPFVALRLFGVFGIGEGPQRLVPYLIERLRHDQPADLTAGEQARDFLYVEDVVEAFMLSAGDGVLTPYEAYNVCSGRPVRIREIGELVADVMNKPRNLLRWGRRPYRQDEPMWIVGDNRRFAEATSWRPKVSLPEGIRRMIAAAPAPHFTGGRDI
jgi:nucleoside-diphosphate-sugar epimerase